MGNSHNCFSIDKDILVKYQNTTMSKYTIDKSLENYKKIKINISHISHSSSSTSDENKIENENNNEN